MKFQTVTLWSTTDKIICPVKAAAKIIIRLLSLPQSSSSIDDAFIYTYFDTTTKSINHLSPKFAHDYLRHHIHTHPDCATLGFQWHEIGLHSIRSSAAMAIFLTGVSNICIQMISRWASDAFLAYIRSQVREFSKGVAQQMIQSSIWHHTEHSYTSPPPSTTLQWPPHGESGAYAS